MGSPWGRKESDTTERLSLSLWASLIAQLVKPGMLSREDPLEKGQATHSSFPCGSAGKESTCNAGDLGLILGLGRSPGEGKGYPLQYSGLENSVDCIVSPWVAKSHTAE